MSFRQTIRIAQRAWNQGKFRGLSAVVRWKAVNLTQKLAYRKWVRKFGSVSGPERMNLERNLSRFSRKPLISIILPVYDVDEQWIRRCIDSVLRQIYPDWELCIADDCSRRPHVRKVLEEYGGRDERIKIVFRNENGHISAASNSALAIAEGEFVVLLDHDDELTEDALYFVAKEINDHPEVQMMYSDEDLIDKKGRRFSPKFKPDWARDLFYSANITTHLSAFRTTLVRKLGGFRIGCEGSQDYDLVLRVIEEVPENSIRHIPRILYHWRVLETSVASDGKAKPYAHDAARRAISDHLARIGKHARVTKAVHNLHRVRYLQPDRHPFVSIIWALTAGSDPEPSSLSTLAARTGYSESEIVIVLPPDAPDRREEHFRDIAPRSVSGNPWDLVFVRSIGQGRSAMLNAGASRARGEVLCFLDPNLMPQDELWLEEVVSFAIQEETGAAGAKIVDRCGTVLHAGFLIGVGGPVVSAHRGLPQDAEGNLTRALLVGSFSAVSASCMAMRRNVFVESGGFDSTTFPNRLFDADLCLRLRGKEYRIVWTPYAKIVKTDDRAMLNFEMPISAGEKEEFERRWAEAVRCDPFHNPNFSRGSDGFLIDPGVGPKDRN